MRVIETRMGHERFVVGFDVTKRIDMRVIESDVRASSFMLVELLISLGADLGVLIDAVRIREGAWLRLARGSRYLSSVDVFGLLSTFFPFLFMVNSLSFLSSDIGSSPNLAHPCL